MRHDKLDGTHPTEEAQLSRRSLLLGLVATGAFAVPLLSTSTQAAVSMLRGGIDPDAAESEIIPAGKKGGGKGGGGRGGGGRGKGHGGGHKGRGRGGGHGGGHRGRGHGKSRSYHHYYYGRRRYGYGRSYGGYGWGCYNPWYRRRYWYRCVGWY